jgi:hypothetical protein
VNDNDMPIDETDPRIFGPRPSSEHGTGIPLE